MADQSNRRTGESLGDMLKAEVPIKVSKKQSPKIVKHQKVKKLKAQEAKPKLTGPYSIYLTAEQRKKLRHYAAEHEKTLSEVLGTLIDKNL